MERLYPILVYIQAHLDQDLALESLANRADLSTFYFHRIFRATVGETLKQYVQRLRLEQAAFRLKVQQQPVIDVAFDLGFQSHESFTRAFRKHFGLAPQHYKQEQRLRFEPTMASNAQRPALNEQIQEHAISTVRVRRLEPMTVAFIRHLGEYTEADTTAHERLIEWAITTGRYGKDNLLLGVGHDDPTITPGEKVRYDACLQVPTHFPATGEIGCQTLAGGLHATVTYVGPYGPDFYQAYAAIFGQMHNHPDYTLVGLPAIEIYRTTRINPDYALNHTEVFLPVRKKGN